jgi:putative toxin-antitoxin system antitoxin component (TIGR02293 family)
VADGHLRRFVPGAAEVLRPALAELRGEGEDVVESIKEGLSAETFQRLQSLLETSQRELAQALRIPLRTLTRRLREGRFQPDESERIWRIGRIFALAAEVLGGEENARRWLTAPRGYLGGSTPLAYSDTEPGARAVENLLWRIEYGVYS